MLCDYVVNYFQFLGKRSNEYILNTSPGVKKLCLKTYKTTTTIKCIPT